MHQRVERLRAYARAFGLIRGPAILARLYSARDSLVSVEVPGWGAPLYLRGGTSDKTTFEQVFVSHAYDTSFLEFRPEVIIDAGANAGFATRFLAEHYPWARIVAIEPEPSNFELLVRNTRHLSSVLPLEAALWPRVTPLAIANPEAEKWAFKVVEGLAAGEVGVTAVTVPDIMARLGTRHVDILKVDIEGAEKELFEGPCEGWLDRVNALIVELHDRLRPGCGAAFYRAIGPYAFRVVHRGEHVILVRQPPLVLRA